MGYFTWTLANKKVTTTKYGDYYNKCKLQYGGYGCVMCPDGSVIEEKNYEGYGIFDGKDIYELVVDWNKQHLVEIIAESEHPIGIYRDLAEAYINGGTEAAQKTIDHAVANGAAPRFLLTDWKRCLGVEIACTNNPNIPFPIKITDTPTPKLSYDQLPASLICQ